MTVKEKIKEVDRLSLPLHTKGFIMLKQAEMFKFTQLRPVNII